MNAKVIKRLYQSARRKMSHRNAVHAVAGWLAVSVKVVLEAVKG